jgi:sirohydrochlorin cobaltochelatase
VENDEQIGYLIVGHGTRDATGQSQMREVAAAAARFLSPVPTELSFLELAEPTIRDGVAALAARGVRRLCTIPVLLFRAGHADHDIPDAVAAAAEELGVAIAAQADPLELQSPVLRLSARRFRQALEAAGCGACAPDDIALAMIARGSSSAAAANKMGEFACARYALEPVSWCGIGYVAVRSPTVPEILDALAQQSAPVLVVQPHLLFSGEVLRSIESQVQARAAHSDRKWIVTGALGAPLPSAAGHDPDAAGELLGQVLAELGQAVIAKP